MKLWIILKIAGVVGASWGPIPLDEAGCRQLVAEKNAELVLTMEDPATFEQLNKNRPGTKIGDFVLSCVWADTRPRNENEDR